MLWPGGACHARAETRRQARSTAQAVAGFMILGGYGMTLPDSTASGMFLPLRFRRLASAQERKRHCDP